MGGYGCFVIRQSSHVCQGRPHINNTRIPVWLVVGCHQQGLSDEEILTLFPNLTPADLTSVWAFYMFYRDEVDRDVRQHTRPG